ncbi:MAG TPA: RodZ domain-containing protein [Actinomycetes bacterium]|nr:RodZ domain-containing protein [Actinomycetes bacterium]
MTIGEKLRSAREAQGKTIQEASAATRIKPSYLEALEAERFGELGGNVYAKGFIRSYAGYLGLDPTSLLEEFRAAERPEAPVFERAPRALSGLGLERRRRAPSGWLVVAIVFVSIVLVASLWSLVKPPRTTSQGPLGAATPPVASTTTTIRPTTTTEARAEGVTVVLRYLGRSWTKVTSDGKLSFEGIPGASERRTFKADRSLELMLGAPAVVELTVNGKAMGIADSSGRVYRHAFTSGDGGTGSNSADRGSGTTDSNLG